MAYRKAKREIAIIGGGAAGYFGAIALAEALHASGSTARITIFEAGRRSLEKVRISGGGRCNLTHACFDARALVDFYPRGAKALRGVFSRFQPRDTIEWFEARGVPTKVEDDGRVFPVSDRSESIIACLREQVQRYGIQERFASAVRAMRFDENTKTYYLKSAQSDAAELAFDRVLFAPGGSPGAFRLAGGLGHRIVPPVPSIFTFSIDDALLKDLAGVAVPVARVRLPQHKLESAGPVLITHWGLSGPAVLRLSALAARELFAKKYQAQLRVNWCGESEAVVREFLENVRGKHGARQVGGECQQLLPARLWRRLCELAGITKETTWAQLPGKQFHALLALATASELNIKARGVFKEEFVTAGGIDLRDVDFRTMQSRCLPGLYFAGEVLDVDGLTGGFNFQNAWSTAWIAGRALAAELATPD